MSNFLSVSIETMQAIGIPNTVTTKQANLKQAVISSKEPNWYVSFLHSAGSA